MSNFKVSFTVGDHGPFEAEIEDVEPIWFPAKYEDKAVVDSEGNAVLDEIGAAKTERVVLESSHFEPEQTAVLRVLREAVEVSEYDKVALEEAAVTIEYRITGSVSHYFASYGLEDIADEDALVDAIENGNFDSELQETIMENIDSYDIEIQDVTVDSVS